MTATEALTRTANRAWMCLLTGSFAVGRPLACPTISAARQTKSHIQAIQATRMAVSTVVRSEVGPPNERMALIGCDAIAANKDHGGCAWIPKRSTGTPSTTTNRMTSDPSRRANELPVRVETARPAESD